MTNRFHNFFVFILLLCMASCSGQNKTNIPEKKSIKNVIVGGPFENGEFMYYGMPETISAVDTSAAWHLDGQKLMIQGRMFREDGKTPAPNVILYYYQTDTAGYYSDHESLDPRAKRHGYIRGWVKSDDQGNYTIYTVRPAPYPNRKEPAHIHISVKEPNIEKEYYLDELVFDDDRLLNTEKEKH
ncbi:intradiol ring-cleavage dioxygenase [Maribacter halichondriae]|uniref:dioxygenase family protein n=1 Tax=Maribacter halichondriae TaxID=2980554 RepID=UPI002359A822|nr:intradiol ring-cleavage dioxygenase [Maribacter sp. Hal144]